MDVPAFPENQAYWDAAAQGRLLIKHCDACGENHHYPRAHCPFCLSPETRWLEAAGEGLIYSFTIWRRRDKTTVPALVTLAEGPTIMTEIVGSDLDRLAIGDRVRLAAASAERPIPTFLHSVSEQI